MALNFNIASTSDIQPVIDSLKKEEKLASPFALLIGTSSHSFFPTKITSKIIDYFKGEFEAESIKQLWSGGDPVCKKKGFHNISNIKEILSDEGVVDCCAVQRVDYISSVSSREAVVIGWEKRFGMVNGYVFV